MYELPTINQNWKSTNQTKMYHYFVLDWFQTKIATDIFPCQEIVFQYRFGNILEK